MRAIDFLKPILICMLVAGLPACGGAGSGNDVPDTMYVTARSGLILRSGPGRENVKQGWLHYGAEIVIKETSEKSETIQGKTGNWVYVKQNSDMHFDEGWCFSGYLSKTALKDQTSDNNKRLEALRHCVRGCAGADPSEDGLYHCDSYCEAFTGQVDVAIE